MKIIATSRVAVALAATGMLQQGCQLDRVVSWKKVLSWQTLGNWVHMRAKRGLMWVHKATRTGGVHQQPCTSSKTQIMILYIIKYISVYSNNSMYIYLSSKVSG